MRRTDAYNRARLHAIDLVIIVGYLAAVVAAGAWFGRRQETTTRYFLAGHGVPWWAISASIVATETSTITFISVPGIAYARGGDFTFLQLVFGYLVGRVVISLLFIPSYFRGELVTVYQLLQERFGWRVRALASTLFIVMRTIADGVRLLLTALVLAAVYGSVAGASAESVVALCVAGIGVVMIVFTFYGGMGGGVWIEVVQLGIYIGGAAAAAIVLIRDIPGGLSAAMALGHAHLKFRVFDFSTSLRLPFSFWAGVIGGCFLTMSTRGTDRHILNVSRIVTIVAGVVQIVVGLALRHQTESALSTALGVASLINGPVLGIFLLGSMRRGGPKTALIAMSAGLAVVLWVRFATAVAWPWYTVIGAMTTVLIGAATSRLER